MYGPFIVSFSIMIKEDKLSSEMRMNMDLRLDEYVRDHVPSFIYDYVPPKRDDWPYYQQKYGLKDYDIWDLMIATKRRSRDDYTVEHKED